METTRSSEEKPETFTVSRGTGKPPVLSWADVSLTVRTKDQAAPTKQVISRMHGAVQAGEMVAIMGASGAGKTSLLDVLARRTEGEGKVLVEGHKLSRASASRKIAFVQQDDLLFPTLTVREQIDFAAHMLLPPDQRKQRADEVLKLLNLEGCQHTRVGGMVGVMTLRGISGGERKRLACGLQMLQMPPVLFADEPTSGLDSALAAQVVSVFRSLAERQQAVVCTIHQPSSQVFASFDHLCLLARGRTVFFGPISEVLAYFEQLGHTCPAQFNPADFLIEVTSVPADDAVAAARVDALIAAWEQREAPDAPADKSEWPDSGEDKGERKSTLEAMSTRPGWFGEAVLMYQRQIVITARDPLLTKARMGQTIFMSLLIGLIYFQIGDDQQGVQDRNGAIFMLIVNQCMMGLMGVLQTFPVEKFTVRREVESGLYRPSTYYVAKLVADIPFQVFFPALFMTITFWMLGLGELEQYVKFVLVGSLASNAAIGLGYLISALVPSVGVALAVGPLVIMPFMIFGGLFVNADSVPVYFVWLQLISFVKYGYSAAMITVWQGVMVDCPAPPQMCFYRTGDEVLDFLNIDADMYLRDIVVLIGMTAGFRVLAFGALYRSLTKR